MEISSYDPPEFVAWVLGDASKLSAALDGRSWTSPWVFPKVLNSVLRGIAQVCFANNPASGMFILAGLLVGDFLTGVNAVLCSLIAIVTAKFIQQDDGAICCGLTNFSAVLVGTVVTALYPVFFNAPFGGAVWLYMIATAAFSVCVGAGLSVIMGQHNLPGFTLPFNIATSITFLCLRARGFGNTVETVVVVNGTVLEEISNEIVDDAINWNQVWLGTLLSAGQVYAVESVACSVLLLAGLFLCSPILATVSYMGGLLGCFTALAVSSPPYSLVYAGVWGYNGFLSAGCLAFFMVPTPRIILLGAINAVFTTFLQAAVIPVFAANQLPVFTMPFCLSSLLFLALATNAGMGSQRVANPSYPERHAALHFKLNIPPEAPGEEEPKLGLHQPRDLPTSTSNSDNCSLSNNGAHRV